MKKAVILIVIIGLAVVAVIGGFSIEKNKLNSIKKVNNNINTNNQSTTVNTITQTNNTTTSQNISKNSNESTNINQNMRNQNENNNTSTSINKNNQIQDLNISPNFTQDEINTLTNLGDSQQINMLSGTASPVINLNYYSIVNGEKYYMEYENSIPYITFSPNNNPRVVVPNKNKNYSEVSFQEYVNANGQTINQSEFLNGNLSFNPNNTSNLTNQDKINMIKKIASMYFNYGGYECQRNSFNVSKQYLENGVGNNNISINNMKVNLNNTINVEGQTLYELEVETNEPFYISLTGLVYTNQEHYLSKPFNIPSYTNTQVKELEKGM